MSTPRVKSKSCFEDKAGSKQIQFLTQIDRQTDKPKPRGFQQKHKHYCIPDELASVTIDNPDGCRQLADLAGIWDNTEG